MPVSKYEELLGLIIAEIRPFEAEAKEPLFFLRSLFKKGFTEDEIESLTARLKEDGLVAADHVVGDGEFDRVIEIDRDALLRFIAKSPRS